MIDFSLYNYELKDILREMVRCEMSNVKRTSKGFAFNCPICGEKRQRATLMIDNSSYGFVMNCFNSGDCELADSGGMSAIKFLKKYHKPYYTKWVKECMKMHNEDAAAKEERKKRAAQEAYMVERKVPIIQPKMGKPDISNLKEFIQKNGENIQKCVSIRDHQPAIDWCKSRMIPAEVYMTWLYIPEDSGKLSDRIIIPFDNPKGQIYFFQARTLGNGIPKYLNAVSTLRPIYNYYEADFDKPVMIVEGPIDSLFLENSIALLGTKYNDELLAPIKQKYFIFDNDSAGRTEAIKQLEKGEYVFLWKKFIRNFVFVKDKVDINNLAVLLKKELFTFEEMKPYFTNNLSMKAFI